MDEDRHQHDGGDREAERDAQPVRACLQQTLQTNRDRHGIVRATRHRQDEREHGAAAIARGRLRRQGPPRQLQDLRAFFRRRAREHAQVAGLVGFDDRDRIDDRIGFHQVVQRISNVERIERRRPLREGVGGRSRSQARRIDKIAIDVPLEQAHFQVRHARGHAEHDERDEERQPRAEGDVPKPVRHALANGPARRAQWSLFDRLTHPEPSPDRIVVQLYRWTRHRRRRTIPPQLWRRGVDHRDGSADRESCNRRRIMGFIERQPRTRRPARPLIPSRASTSSWCQERPS